ncbi:MAG: YceD family protein [Arenimonas sp.]
MSATLPAVIDVWRMVSARRHFSGSFPLAAFTRLRGSLVDTEGECRFTLEFGHDAMNQAFVEVRAEAELPLQCQRTMERYLQPVRVMQQLGLITSEAQESALPEGMEPLLVPESSELRPIDLVEDELILALPVVPINPESSLPEAVWPLEEEDKPNPFAVLGTLKDHTK